MDLSLVYNGDKLSAVPFSIDRKQYIERERGGGGRERDRQTETDRERDRQK